MNDFFVPGKLYRLNKNRLNKTPYYVHTFDHKNNGFGILYGIDKNQIFMFIKTIERNGIINESNLCFLFLIDKVIFIIPYYTTSFLNNIFEEVTTKPEF